MPALQNGCGISFVICSNLTKVPEATFLIILFGS
jgi:hypothetical protein